MEKYKRDRIQTEYRLYHFQGEETAYPTMYLTQPMDHFDPQVTVTHSLSWSTRSIYFFKLPYEHISRPCRGRQVNICALKNKKGKSQPHSHYNIKRNHSETLTNVDRYDALIGWFIAEFFLAIQ